MKDRFQQVINHIINFGEYECDTPTNGFYIIYNKLLETVKIWAEHETQYHKIFQDVEFTLENVDINVIITEGRYNYVYYLKSIKNIPIQTIGTHKIVPIQVGVFQPSISYGKEFRGESILLVDVDEIITESKNYKRNE